MVKRVPTSIICYFVVFYFVFLNNLVAQDFSAKFYLGAMYYQGDLSPRPFDFSFGPGNMTFGISIGKDLKDWVSFHGRFMLGRLSGDDAFSNDANRRSRNLRFSTSLCEYGVYSDLKINKLWKSLNKYKLRIFLTIGLNLIHFNPRTFYNGQWVNLQAIGTEGQTLVGSGKEKYSLYGISRPIGIILEFDLSRHLLLGMEVTPRRTYTDYLDDVSGTYVNYDEMVAAGNQLGANLSNRTGEYFGTDNVRVPTGTPRGNLKNNDWYTLFALSFKYKFGSMPAQNFIEKQDEELKKETIK
ncbi:MAG: hypothetical protein IPO92_12450 [Saprospiraceae bacterium]|nr:hypothetical protein [Saprospiraceae bacterium]